MEWLTGLIAQGINWAQNLFSQKTSSNVSGSGSGSNSLFSTVGNVATTTASKVGGMIENILPDKIIQTISDALGMGSGETPFELDIKYQGAVSGEIGSMKTFAEKTLAVLQPGQESVRDWIVTNFNANADILSSGKRNVADPGGYKNILTHIYQAVTGKHFFTGADLPGETIEKNISKATGAGVSLTPTSTALAGITGTGSIQEALESLVNAFTLPVSSGVSGAGTTVVPGTPSVIMTGGGSTGQGSAGASSLILPLAVGGILLFLLLKKGKVFK